MLLIGSLCSIGAIRVVTYTLKLVLQGHPLSSQAALDGVWSDAQFVILVSSIAGRLLIGKLADMLPMKYVMTATYFFVAAAIPLLLGVTPSTSPYIFAVVFGFAMGADYMLIPLMAAKQFGVNSLARAMAIILPGEYHRPDLGAVWSFHAARHYGNYQIAMGVVLALAVVGAIAIAVLPRDGADQDLISGKAAPQASRA